MAAEMALHKSGLSPQGTAPSAPTEPARAAPTPGPASAPPVCMVSVPMRGPVKAEPAPAPAAAARAAECWLALAAAAARAAARLPPPPTPHPAPSGGVRAPAGVWGTPWAATGVPGRPARLPGARRSSRLVSRNLPSPPSLPSPGDQVGLWGLGTERGRGVRGGSRGVSPWAPPLGGADPGWHLGAFVFLGRLFPLGPSGGLALSSCGGAGAGPPLRPWHERVRKRDPDVSPDSETSLRQTRKPGAV